MGLGTMFQNVVKTLRDSGYNVVTHPQELLRPNEVYVDISDIRVPETIIDGYTIDVVVSVIVQHVDRVALLDDVGRIVGLLDSIGLKFENSNVDVEGESIVVELVFTYSEVIVSV